MMQDEDPKDVQEFLEYHRWIGVDSFYLREHGEHGSKEVLQVLEPYERAGVLDFGVMPAQLAGFQTRWYNRCSAIAARKHAWVAFIDIDEFIVVLDGGKAVAEEGALKAVLRRSFRFAAAVSMQAVLFGSGGHKERPGSGQLAGFRQCTGRLSRQMKCLGNAYWLHRKAAFLPLRTQQCVSRVGGVAVLGNNEPLELREVDMRNIDTSQAVTLVDPEATRLPAKGLARVAINATGVTYMGHLSSGAYADNWSPAARYQLALFHYVTGAEDAFLARKYARAGKLGALFESMASAAGLERHEAVPGFQAEVGLDGDAEVCREGAALAAAMAAARDAGGWSPLPAQKGLLFV